MYGRNGPDQLGTAMILLCLILELTSTLLFRHSRLLSQILHLTVMVLWVLVLFRIFSTNLPKRRAENQKLLNLIGKAQQDRINAKARRDDRDHKYFTCKNCGAICRVPAGKGKIEITCPKCGAKIQGKS